jgi:DNA-binding beta-propeller fold protein YncE
MAARSLVPLLTLSLFLTTTPARSQDYTIVALSHTDNMVSEHEPMSGRVLNKFVVPGPWVGEVHEGAITPDGKTMYVSVPYSKYVLILDLETFTEKGRIESEFFSRPEMMRSFARGVKRATTTTDPHGVALNNTATKVYVTVEFAEVPGVVVYDVKSRKVIKKIDTVVPSNYLWVQPKTDKLYVPTRADRVLVIDTKSDTIKKVIPVQGAPNGVDFAPNGEVWVNGNADGSVSVIDSATDTVTHVIQTKGKGTGRVAVSPDGRWVAATVGPQVAVIDAQAKSIRAMFPTTESGQGFPLFSPDSATLFVMNEVGGDMAIFDMKTMSDTGRRYPLGGASFGGGIRLKNRD